MAFSDPGVRAVAVDDEEFRIEFDSTAMLIVSLREDGDGRDRPRRAEPGTKQPTCDTLAVCCPRYPRGHVPSS
jgi:hypothetical protein